MSTMAAPRRARTSNDAEWVDAAFRLERARARLAPEHQPRQITVDEVRTPDQVAARLKVLAHDLAVQRAGGPTDAT